MQLAPLEISDTEARDKLAEYEAALRAERNAEDEAIAAGYRAAARGLPIIRLSQTVAAGGFDDRGLPNIAVARADAVECWVRWSGSAVVFTDQEWRSNRGALVGAHTVRVPIADPPERDRYYWRAGHTMAPLIPPAHRPRPRRLRRCHLLWEVEAWELVPPRDPALIRHIRGDLWAVLAVWDKSLTEARFYAKRC